MEMLKLSFIAVLIACVTCSDDEVKPKILVSSSDSYLDAFKESQKAALKSTQAAKKEYVVPNGYPDAIYNHHAEQYGPPKPAYGPPIYGPPAVPSHSYGPPHYEPPPFYGMPHALLGGILDKFKLKIDLFTLGKILLKLVIFKKIVSFIAIICLLLFIPTLKHDKDESMEEEMMRNYQPTTADEKINTITTFVLDAIESFSKKQTENERSVCDSLYCKAMNVVKRINKKMTYKKLFKIYAKEVKQK